MRLARLDVPRERVGGAQGDGDRDAVQDERVEPRRVRQLAPVARLAHVAEVVHQDRDRGEEQEPRPAPRPHGGPRPRSQTPVAIKQLTRLSPSRFAAHP